MAETRRETGLCGEYLVEDPPLQASQGGRRGCTEVARLGRHGRLQLHFGQCEFDTLFGLQLEPLFCGTAMLAWRG